MGGLILAFITGFIIVLVSTPVLIKVAKIKHLVDEPGEDRKVHHRSVPTLGGIMIFAGTIIAYSLWFPSGGGSLGANYDDLSALQDFKYLVASMFILFFMGLKDDIIGMGASKKLLVHLGVGFILVFMADIRITDFNGLFGFYEIPDWVSFGLSMFVYIVIVNAINLIDGVDGLAGGVSFIGASTFVFWFYQTGDLPLALLATGLAGSILGFLVFNFSPAKIFMGDSGSLIIGVVMFVLVVKMVEFDETLLTHAIQGPSKPVMAMAILCYPLIDTLRVFTIRVLKGKSPFSADKNHIHHKLLSLGLSHKQTVFVLYLYSLLIIGLAFSIPKTSPNVSFAIVGGTALILAQIVFLIKPKKKS